MAREANGKKATAGQLTKDPRGLWVPEEGRHRPERELNAGYDRAHVVAERPRQHLNELREQTEAALAGLDRFLPQQALHRAHYRLDLGLQLGHRAAANQRICYKTASFTVKTLQNLPICRSPY